jgi:hypothetical protein
MWYSKASVNWRTRFQCPVDSESELTYSLSARYPSFSAIPVAVLFILISSCHCYDAKAGFSCCLMPRMTRYNFHVGAKSSPGSKD